MPGAKKRKAAAAAAAASSQAKPAPASVAPASRTALAAAVTAALLVLVAIPGGPFAFLPAALRWPATLLTALALWLPLAKAADHRVPRHLDTILEAVGLTLVFGTYLGLKLVGLHAASTDENIYFYFAVRLGQGAVPYRDFFFAHPPVHLLVPALIFKVTGFSIGVAKCIPVLAQATAGLFLYLTARRASRGLALCALGLHLTAYQVLMGSTDMNGENIMTAFLIAALYVAIRGRFLWAGILAGLALGTGLYALAGVLAVGLACLGASRRAGVRFGVGLLGAFGGLLVVFGVLAGGPFFDGVFAYHLAKPAKADRLPVFASLNPFAILGALAHNLSNYLGSSEFKKSVLFHGPLYLGGAGAVGLILGRALHARLTGAAAGARALLTPRDLCAGTPTGLAKVGLGATLLFMLQWAGLNEIYDFYAVPMMPFLALSAAYALWEAIRAAAAARIWADLRLPALTTAVFALHLPLAQSLNRSLFPDEERDAGTVVRYEWRDPQVLAGAAGITRALFFSEERVKGEITPPYRHYQWNKLLTFSTAEEVARHVRDHTAPDETVTGASTVAPLVALLAGRRMAGDEADTNNKRFTSGVLTEEQFLARICRDKVRYVVAAPRSHFSAQLMTRAGGPYAAFEREREIVDTKLLHHGRPFAITLYRRRDVAGLPPGQVCGQPAP